MVAAFTSLPERIILNQTNPAPALGGNRSEYLGGQNPHPFPVLQAYSSSHVDGYQSQPHLGSALRLCSKAHLQYRHGASELRFDRQRWVPVPRHRRRLTGCWTANGVRDTNGDGIREYNGVPLRIVYQTSTNSVRQATQTLIRDWWRQIGIETELVHHDAFPLFRRRARGQHRCAGSSQTYRCSPPVSGIDPQQALSHALCKHIPTRENNWASFNTARSCNPQYDALFPQLEQTQAGADAGRAGEAA